MRCSYEYEFDEQDFVDFASAMSTDDMALQLYSRGKLKMLQTNFIQHVMSYFPAN